MDGSRLFPCHVNIAFTFLFDFGKLIHFNTIGEILSLTKLLSFVKSKHWSFLIGEYSMCKKKH